MNAQLGRLVIYTKRVSEMANFYCKYFGYEAHEQDGDRLIELRPALSGITLLLHPAGKGQKMGQALIKLVFDIQDVDQFCADATVQGLQFGPIHQADGYSFANTKDPSNNSVSVSSRAFASSEPTE